jgi:hypothetical protein
MKRAGRALETAGQWIGARFPWILLGLLGSSPVSAEDDLLDRAIVAGPLPSSLGLQGAPSEIPSGGVIPILVECGAACETFVGEVYEATTGTRVPGRIDLGGAQHGSVWGYFVPDVPLEVGTKLLVTDHTPNGTWLSVEVSVVASPALSAASVGVQAALSKERQVQRTQCCPTVGSFGQQRCIATAERVDVSLLVQLAQHDPSATQYALELTLRDSRESASTVPYVFHTGLPDMPNPMAVSSFDGSAPSYCYKLRAVPLVAGETIELIDHCLVNDLVGLGARERSEAEIAQWLSTCESAPADAGDPIIDDSSDLPRDGGMERHDGDVLEAPPVPIDGGCQLAASSQPSSGAPWSLALALWARRRRRLADAPAR